MRKFIVILVVSISIVYASSGNKVYIFTDQNLKNLGLKVEEYRDLTEKGLSVKANRKLREINTDLQNSLKDKTYIEFESHLEISVLNKLSSGKIPSSENLDKSDFEILLMWGFDVNENLIEEIEDRLYSNEKAIIPLRYKLKKEWTYCNFDDFKVSTSICYDGSNGLKIDATPIKILN